MLLVIFVKKVKRGKKNDKSCSYSLVSKYYCKGRYKEILKKMGKALVDYKNFKSGQESEYKYIFEIKKHVGKKIWSDYTIGERDICDFIEQYENFLEEAKIAQRRFCSCG